MSKATRDLFLLSVALLTRNCCAEYNNWLTARVQGGCLEPKWRHWPSNILMLLPLLVGWLGVVGVLNPADINRYYAQNTVTNNANNLLSMTKAGKQ